MRLTYVLVNTCLKKTPVLRTLLGVVKTYVIMNVCLTRVTRFMCLPCVKITFNMRFKNTNFTHVAPCPVQW